MRPLYLPVVVCTRCELLNLHSEKYYLCATPNWRLFNCSLLCTHHTHTRCVCLHTTHTHAASASACAQVVPCSDVDKVMAELKGHAPGITRYVLDIAGTIDEFGKAQ
jgi:hypothetical protein